MTPSELDELLSGRKKSLAAIGLRLVLWIAQFPYLIATSVRNFFYDYGWKKTYQVEAPVISVGNITTGGTGKTPVVAWLAERFRNQGFRVAIASRGYGAEDGAQNDEALELEARLPDVPHMQNRDRVQVATQLVEELESEVIVLDDAFQHRRIRRDLDIVLIDATRPFGFGYTLPRGLLRESLVQLRRADILCITRAGAVSEAQLSSIRRKLTAYAPEAAIVQLAHQPECLLSCDRNQEPTIETPLNVLEGESVAAFCGIGNPAGFRKTLEACQIEATELREYQDHHPYSRDDIEALAEWAAQLEVSAIVCTVKDLVKIGVSDLGGKPLFAVRIGIAFQEGQSLVESHLDDILGVTKREREAG